MSGIKVTCTVDCYEVDGKEPSTPVGKTRPSITVESHWSRHNMVVIRVCDKSFTVIGADLAAAIENAQNRGAP